MQIKNWRGEVIFEAEVETIKDAIEQAANARANLYGANLSGANLSRANLYGANLSGAGLYRANLSGANLYRANLYGANLSGANLSRANLYGANLSRANLSRANLYGADLYGANLSRANLYGADLYGANLYEEAIRTFKADLFLTLSSLHCGAMEAGHLLAKLRSGEVNGRTYGDDENTCKCLVGTIQDVKTERLDRNSGRPAEQWFLMISPGDTPGKKDGEDKETGGGFAARKAEEWILDWCRCHGVNVDQAATPAS